MKTFNRFILVIAVLAVGMSLNAQDASSRLKNLYNKYSAIPNYRVSVTYVAENEMMGFKNQQNGQLTVVGEKYILELGPNETWLGDGKAEYIGTKETDHSELIIFCPGDNLEVPVNYGKMFTFYNGANLEAIMEGDMIKVMPTDDSYKHALLTVSGNNIEMLIVVDEFDMAHTYTFSGFTTDTSGVQFTIDPKNYEATVDERQGCK